MKIRNISIYEYGDTYALDVTKENGQRVQVAGWPESQQELLNDLLSYVSTLQSPTEQAAAQAFAVVELTASDEQILTLGHLADVWRVGETVDGKMVRWYPDKDGDLYRVIQGHTTQADWTPDVTPSLWVKLTPDEAEGKEVIRWFEPTSTHFFTLGQLMLYTDNKIYESKLNDNVWSPVGYPAGWEYVRDATEEEINGD